MRRRFCIPLGAFFPLLAYGVQWTSTDSKVIEAEFVRIDEKFIELQKAGKFFRFPLGRLDKKLQAFAAFTHQERQKWAVETAQLPILPEKVWKELIALKPNLTNGRRFLMEGSVASVRRAGSTLRTSESPSEVQVTLDGETEVTIDFAGKVDGRKTKMKIESDGVPLLKGRTVSADGYSNFTPAGYILKVGETVVVSVLVQDGKLEASGLARSQEVTKARMELAKKNGGLTA